MILYVNGDSHTAAAEAVNPHAFAEDDPALSYLGRTPHPANLAVSWGRKLSETLKAGFHCAAESASSNARILRTTRDWLRQQVTYDDVLVIIQWSTWEREEWLYNGVYYQVGASGTDSVPPEAAERYRKYVVDIDWKQKTLQAHSDIWNLHKELSDREIRHIFFNGNTDFSKIIDQKEWGPAFIGPYDPAQTFSALIQAQGIPTVTPNSWHFDQQGHSFWHKYLVNYLIENQYI
jgi:hypothetical protein